MPNLTSIELSAGVPVSGSGHVSTLDNLMSFGISNVALANSTSTIGNVVIQSSANLVLASSTNMIGNVIVQSSANVGLAPGTNMIGNVIVQSSANVGLAAGTNLIGNVGIQSSANIGLAAGTNMIGNVIVQSSANVGLAAGTNMIGNVMIQSSANIGLATGTNMIGNVMVQSSANVGLAAGTNMIGNVMIQSSANIGLAAGTNLIGSVYIQDTLRTTYRYSIAGITPLATPTDFLMIKGSGTATIHVKVIKLWGFSTAANCIYVQLVRRSAAYTTIGSGAFNTITAGKHDTNDSLATANVSYISGGNFTSVGAQVGGPLETAIIAMGPNAQLPVIWNYTLQQDRPLTLRGTGDLLYINFFGNTVPSGGLFTVSIETEEDAL